MQLKFGGEETKNIQQSFGGNSKVQTNLQFKTFRFHKLTNPK